MVLGIFGVVLMLDRLDWLTVQMIDFFRAVGLDFIADLAEI
jgi:hypothetical protein